MKVSELTAEYVASWLGYVAEGEALTDSDRQEITLALSAAVNHAVSYTGHIAEELDSYEDVTIAVIGLCNDFLVSNRPEAAGFCINRMSEGILAMHSKNLL